MRVTGVVVVAALVVLGLLALAGWPTGEASAQTEPEAQAEAIPAQRTVTVTGQGRLAVQADMARVRFGVENQAETAVEAMEANSVLMTDVLSATVAAGVEESDIQTQGLRLFAVFESTADGDQPAEVAGYRAANVVEVTVRDLESLGGLLDEVVAAGGNTIESIQFEVGDSAAAQAAAREAAMANAEEKAAQLVELAGGELGRVLTIVETGQAPPVPVVFGRDLAQAEAAVPIQPGTQTLEAIVQVTWEIVEP
jgi:uncharacterized protein YggE